MTHSEFDASSAISIDNMITETVEPRGIDWAIAVVCIALTSTAGWIIFLLWVVYRTIGAVFF
jgi:hypothetical protein